MKNLTNIFVIALMAFFIGACSQSDDGLIVEDAAENSNIDRQESITTMLPRKLKPLDELRSDESACTGEPYDCSGNSLGR